MRIARVVALILVSPFLQGCTLRQELWDNALKTYTVAGRASKCLALRTPEGGLEVKYERVRIEERLFSNDNARVITRNAVPKAQLLGRQWDDRVSAIIGAGGTDHDDRLSAEDVDHLLHRPHESLPVIDLTSRPHAWVFPAHECILYRRAGILWYQPSQAPSNGLFLHRIVQFDASPAWWDKPVRVIPRVVLTPAAVALDVIAGAVGGAIAVVTLPLWLPVMAKVLDHH